MQSGMYDCMILRLQKWWGRQGIVFKISVKNSGRMHKTTKMVVVTCVGTGECGRGEVGEWGQGKE